MTLKLGDMDFLSQKKISNKIVKKPLLPYMDGLFSSVVRFLLLFVLLISVACVPVIENHGYHFSETQLRQIRKNQTRKQVETILGTPSITSVSNSGTIYYVWSLYRKASYHDPHVGDRYVMAFKFNDTNRLSSVALYTLKNGNSIQPVKKKSRFYGRQPGFLVRFLSRIGDFSIPQVNPAPENY